MCPDACATRTEEEEEEEIELVLTDADINDDGLFELYKAFYITGDFGSSKNRGHGSFDPSWIAPMLKPEDLLGTKYAKIFLTFFFRLSSSSKHVPKDYGYSSR